MVQFNNNDIAKMILKLNGRVNLLISLFERMELMITASQDKTINKKNMEKTKKTFDEIRNRLDELDNNTDLFFNGENNEEN